MLLGRRRERGRIDALFAQARAGASGAMALIGDPGIGKSALLADAFARADGLTALWARGVESEIELAFSGLAQLLRPVLRHLQAIPGPQAAAMAGALALGPPMPGDPFTIYAATLSLLAAAAEERPVLVVVDDLHWLDAASSAALLFVARRLRAEGIAVLFSARPGFVRFPPEVSELELAGLDHESARALLGRSAPGVDPRIADHLVAETGGNPLALLELPAVLSEGQLQGREPLQQPLPVGERVKAERHRRNVQRCRECGRRGNAGLPQDLGDRRCRDADTDAGEFTDHPLVAPARVLTREAQHELTNLLRYRGSAWPPPRIRPSLPHKLAMPIEQRVRTDEERACPAAKQLACRSKEDAVRLMQPWTRDLAAKHG